MTRNSRLRRKQPLRKTSSKQAAELRRYRELRRRFLEEPENQWCPVAKDVAFPHQLTRTNDVHHMRGRRGSLLNDTRYWLAVSRWGHQWIHDHPNEARAKGWLK